MPAEDSGFLFHAAFPNSRCANVLDYCMVSRMEPLGIGLSHCGSTEHCISGFPFSKAC
jgi:hypothetical protein